MRQPGIFRFGRAALLSALTLCAGSALANIPGDLNGDGKVNVADATMALQISVGLVTPTQDQIVAGDVGPVDANGVYGDKKITVGDATRLLQRAVGLIPDDQFPGVKSINDTTTGPTQGVPLPTTYNNISIAGDTNRDFQLPGGFKLQGNLTGAKDPSVTDESLLILQDTGSTTTPFAGANVSDPIEEDNKYLVGVPAGTYRVYYQVTVEHGGEPTTGGTTTGGATTGGIPCIPPEVWDQIPVESRGGLTECTDTGTTTGGTTGGTTTGGTTTGGTTTGSTTGIPDLPCVPPEQWDQIPPEFRAGLTECTDTGTTTGGTTGGTTTGGVNGLHAGGTRPLQVPGSTPITSTEVTLLLGTIQVSADTSKDWARPILPQLFKVQGKLNVTGKDLALPYDLNVETAGALQNPLAFTEGATADTSSPDGNYTVYLPAGTYLASIAPTDANHDFNRDTDTPATPQFTVSGDLTQDLAAAIPDAVLANSVTLSGAVTLNGVAFPGTAGTVTATSDDTHLVDTSKSGSITSGKYSFKVEPSTYKVSAQFNESSFNQDPDNFLSSWSFAAGSVNVPADTVFDINVPALPAKVTFSGRILGLDGAPLTESTLIIQSTQVAGNPNLTFRTTVSGSKVGANGAFSVKVPPGVYTVLVHNELDFPVAFIFDPSLIPGGTG